MLGLSAHASAQEAVNLVPELSEGRGFTYELKMQVSVSQKTGDAPAQEVSIDSTARIHCTVIEITQTGAASVEMAVQQVQLRNEVGEESESYAWPLDNELPEDAPAIAQLGRVLSEATINLFVAEGGEAIIAGGLESFVEAAEDIAGSKGHFLLGLFNPDTLGATLTPLFMVDGARLDERRLDDSWEVAREAQILPIGMMRLESSYELVGISDGLASYRGMTTISMADSHEGSSAAAALEIVEQMGQIEGAFDMAAQLMHSRSKTMNLRTQWSVGEIVMEQTQESTIGFQLIDSE
jgi:hypothetical protein